MTPMYLDLDDENSKSPYVSIMHITSRSEANEDNEDEDIEIGRRYRLPETEEVVIGNGINSHIQLPSDLAVERHAKIFFQDGSWYLKNLSPDRTTYNEFEVTSGIHRLKKDGEIFRVGNVFFKFFNGFGVESLYDKKNLARSRIDTLTKVYNRKYLFEKIEDELSWFARPALRNFAVIMFDVDHFKQLNENYGHLGADKVLKTVCERVQKRLRKHEKLTRYAGDEFIVVMPESGHAKAVTLAEEIRALIADEPIEYRSEKIPVTLSIGVVALEKEEGVKGTVLPVSDIIEIADKRMFESKDNGRNKVSSDLIVNPSQTEEERKEEN